MPPSSVNIVSRSPRVIPGLIASTASITLSIDLVSASGEHGVAGTGCPCCANNALAHAGTRARQKDRRGIILISYGRISASRPDIYQTESRSRTVLSHPRRVVAAGSAWLRAADSRPILPYRRKENRLECCAARRLSRSTQTLKNPVQSWRPESSLFRPSEAAAQAWESFCPHC